MRVVLSLIAALLLAGCATKSGDIHIGPPAYRVGYSSGCDSGFAAAANPYYRFRKDPQMYLSDPMYKQGWDDGYNACKSQYEDIGRMM